MRRMLACVVALAACRSDDKPPPPPPPTAPELPPVNRPSLIAGKLPDGDPTTELVNVQCQICHTVQYLTQQRLSEAAWKKTVDKMRRFGAMIDDHQAADIVAYAVRYWNPELPARTWTLGAPPAGALPVAR